MHGNADGSVPRYGALFIFSVQALVSLSGNMAVPFFIALHNINNF